MDKSQQEQAKASKDAPVRTVSVGGAGGAAYPSASSLQQQTV